MCEKIIGSKTDTKQKHFKKQPSKVIHSMRRPIPFIILLFTGINIIAQNQLAVDGYISQLGSSQFSRESSNATWDYVWHNRLNMAWYPSDKFTLKLQFRNQFLWGQSINSTSDYANLFGADKGMVDMSWNWFDGTSTLLNTQIDRLYGEYNNGNLEVTLGRQRINWGRSLVWNPNDIFNAYSYYDFDYAEKPGADALRAVYYTGIASSVELVSKVDSTHNITIAALTKFNKWGYDIQFLGGYVNSEDFILGTGWEGNIYQFSLRGEISYYHPQKSFADTTGVWLATIGTDISLNNRLTVQAEFLYNDKQTVSSLTELMTAPANSKSLSISQFNLFANVNYAITPIISAYMAGMYYSDQNGFFLMPGFDLSLSNNLYFSMIYQYFNLNMPQSDRLVLNFAFARLKWNF
jgi:hypothetical protein